ncbi:MAG: hypothetical protein JOY68_06760 [Candidatus Dormibacteraeota bacterium]|nr:hypothetical protein [Candidatus Dormibacteraeota bacterium]MBV8445964.1 hypothetical protein [Candidatus Dormibacteraeota bacterium]
MIGIRREGVAAPAPHGLGRQVVPDSRMLSPRLHECARTAVHDDERTVCVSWVRPASQGLHSIDVDYGRDSVRLALNLGTRPEFAGRTGYVVVRMIVEHAAVKLREPLRGRRLDVVQPATAVTRSS